MPLALTVNDTGALRYAVVLRAAPTGNVTVGISSDDTTVATVTKSSLTFTASNWEVAQTVTVQGVANADVDGTRRTAISHTISGGGYGEVVVPSVRVTVLDTTRRDSDDEEDEEDEDEEPEPPVGTLETRFRVLRGWRREQSTSITPHGLVNPAGMHIELGPGGEVVILVADSPSYTISEYNADFDRV